MKLIAHYPEMSAEPERGERNWRENYLNDRLYYSHRDTQYEKSTYPSTLHYHDYYELLVYVRGDIHYICEAQSYRPQYADVILVPPGRLHMSMLDGERTRYERHVFYFYPDALDAIGGGALTDFLRAIDASEQLCVRSVRDRRALLEQLEGLDGALRAGTPAEAALALSYVLRIFYAVNDAPAHSDAQAQILPESVLEIQRYIDENFTSISSVGEVARHFYYSREYVSRLFKQHFNTTVADYLRTRRVAFACVLIAKGEPLADVCFRAGFGNLSTFIRSFRAVTGMNPSTYRASQ